MSMPQGCSCHRREENEDEAWGACRPFHPLGVFEPPLNGVFMLVLVHQTNRRRRILISFWWIGDLPWPE